MTKQPFLPVVGPVRKKTLVGIPIQHDSRRSAERIVELRYDVVDASQPDFESRYYGLDDKNAEELAWALCALSFLSEKWRSR